MDKSQYEPLPGSGKRKRGSICTHVLQVALALLMITICSLFLAAPTAFVTLFILESFPSKPASDPRHQPSVLLRKLIPKSNLEYDESKRPVHVQNEKIKLDAPDKIDTMKVFPSTELPKNFLDSKRRIQRSAPNVLEQFSTKDIQRLLELLDSIQYRGKKLKDVSEDDKKKLNYLMDIFGIGHMRERRSALTKDSFFIDKEMEVSDHHEVNPKTDIKDVYEPLDLATLYRLMKILDSLRIGEISLNEIQEEDVSVLNYLMDMEGF